MIDEQEEQAKDAMANEGAVQAQATAEAEITTPAPAAASTEPVKASQTGEPPHALSHLTHEFTKWLAEGEHKAEEILHWISRKM